MLTFEGDATFARNFVHTEDSVEQGKAGAVSNTGSGSILFKGKLTVTENEADVSLIGGQVHTATHCYHPTESPISHHMLGMCERCIDVGRQE